MQEQPQPPLPKNLMWRGKTIWCRLYVDGRELRESTKTSNPTKAEKYLRMRLKHVHEANPEEKFLTSQDRKKTIGDLMDALKTNFELRGKASSQNLSGIARVKKDFGHIRALSLTKEQIAEYVSARRKEDYRPATINRWLQALHCAYKLAEVPCPKLIHLSEADNVRSGFFSDAEIRKVIGHLPEYLRDFALFGWLTGWRKSAIAKLRWSELDGESLVLRAEYAKNRRAHRLPLEGELAEIIERRKQCRKVKAQDGTMRMVEFIFHRDGLQIADFRDSWNAACKMAGVVGKLFHDLRRSACKNMLAARVPQAVAMKISQHVTDSMFRRYAIVEETEMRDALANTQAHLRTQAEAQREKVLTVAVQ